MSAHGYSRTDPDGIIQQHIDRTPELRGPSLLEQARLELARLRELAEDITPAPWVAAAPVMRRQGEYETGEIMADGCVVARVYGWDAIANRPAKIRANAQFVAALVSAFPVLCAALEIEPTMSIYDEIADERAAQDKQWGGPDHDDTHIGADWREYREKFEDRALLGCGATRREALIKIAALAVAQIESLDRKVSRGN